MTDTMKAVAIATAASVIAGLILEAWRRGRLPEPNNTDGG